MEIVAYTLEGCSSCNHLRELLKELMFLMKKKKVRVDLTLEVFMEEFPGVQQFPFVVIDGEKIGGLLEVAKLFVKKGLVSSNKN